MFDRDTFDDDIDDLDIDSVDEDMEEDAEASTASEGVTRAAIERATATGGTTTLDIARMGLSEIAYIRRAVVNDMPMWTIHSAAGDPLGAAHSFDQAWAAVKQNDMEPMRVH